MLLYLFIVITVFLVLFFTLERKKYEQTEYFKQTHNSYWSVRSDKGLYGEYCTYKYLKPLTGYKRFLFNCYLPKSNAEKTEVDVILIHESGIYVLESKNYSGWIFGTETKPYWTQTLPGERGRSKKHDFWILLYRIKCIWNGWKIFAGRFNCFSLIYCI